MRLTVVGCSGSMPGPESPASCYLLETPYEQGTFRMLLDLGSGAIGALQSYVELESVDAVAITHLHADHCLDLCGFYVVRKWQHGRPERVPVFGPPGIADRMARAYDMAADPGMTAQFDFREYDGVEFDVGPFTIQTFAMDHPVDDYALRITENGRTLVYTGDTGPCDSLQEAAEGADVLLCEAAFVEGGDNPEHLHLTGREAATIAAKAGVGRLVLTHVPPWHDREVVRTEAAPHFPGPLQMAVAGLTVDI
jgi:ribonuclease BN (tRNA processing enzyme)